MEKRKIGFSRKIKLLIAWWGVIIFHENIKLVCFMLKTKQLKTINLYSSNMDESNQRQREWFIDYWVNYMKTHSDKEWSSQQNVLINSVLKTAMQLSRKEYLKFKGEQFSKSI